jgi:hypothetical protein
LCRKCGSLDVSQTYGLPWPVAKIALLFEFFLLSHSSFRSFRGSLLIPLLLPLPSILVAYFSFILPVSFVSSALFCFFCVVVASHLFWFYFSINSFFLHIPASFFFPLTLFRIFFSIRSILFYFVVYFSVVPLSLQLSTFRISILIFWFFLFP